MITYKEIFEGLRRSGVGGQRKMMVINHKYAVRAAQMIQILCHAEIAIYDPVTKTYGLHPKQIKPVLEVPPSASTSPKTTPSSDLRYVRVDWQGRGHSSGKYRVVSETEKFVTIEMALDVTRHHTVAKSRTKAA